MTIDQQLIKSKELFNILMNSNPKYYVKIAKILNSCNINDIYVSSDLHFGGTNIHEYDIKVARNNQVIDNNKVLIFLGDIGYKRCENQELIQEYIKKLSKGKFSIFIRGNHDIYDQQFYIKSGFSVFCEEGFIWKNMCFTHIPVKDSNNPNHLINIHGHLHNQLVETTRYYFPEEFYHKTTYIKVFNDLNDFYPYRLSSLLTKMLSKQIIDNNSNIELKKFPFLRQTRNETCAPIAILTILQYYNNYNYDENSLSRILKTNLTTGTNNLNNIIRFFKNDIGWNVISSLDGIQRFNDIKSFIVFIKKMLTEGKPILIENAIPEDHYRIIIGIKDDNILLFMDPYDGKKGAQYIDDFYNSWFDKGTLPATQRKHAYIIAYP